MYVVCVTSKVKPEFAEKFLAASLENSRATRKEPGNLRFDVLRAEDDPSQFFFYEVYRSKADFQSHQQAPHYFKWRDAVNGWMAEPRKGVKHNSEFPEGDSGLWGANS